MMTLFYYREWMQDNITHLPGAIFAIDPIKHVKRKKFCNTTSDVFPFLGLRVGLKHEA